MDKYDTSQITEFPRFEPESTQSGVSSFLNKIWKFPLFSPNESTETVENKEISTGEQKDQSEVSKKEDYDDTKTETGSYAVEFEGRSFANVVKRISSLVALGSKGQGTKYSDTELARYWMPDDISRECYECATRFSTLRRRHHCRVCGQIFCSRCCSQQVPGQIFGCAGGLRVCNYCCNVVLSYLKENDLTGEISPDLRTLQENLQVKFPENKSDFSTSGENFMFARDQEERVENHPAPPLHELLRLLKASLPTHQHRYRLVRYNGVWRGCDILQWIMDNTIYKTRFQASQVCQNLLSSGYMECVSELLQFADYALYRPAVLPDPEDPEQLSSPEEGGRIIGSVSSYCLDLNVGNTSARLTKTAKTEVKSSSSEEESHAVIEQEGSVEPTKICKAIQELGEEHLKLLLRQCLSRAGLSSTWLHTLYPLCRKAAESVTPDMYGNEIDVRKYVQVKKVPGGSPSESCVIDGFALTKNVTHRGMPQCIENPTILLLDCSIAYQRVEDKLTSLEPVLLQEKQYLSRCAARMVALQPRVVLARGGVARGVQDALRAASVALAAHVPPRALRRAARQARATLAPDLTARVGALRLGTAKLFRVHTYPTKTLMIFEGCAEPNLGCCILLRGASLQELIRVKKVVKFMLLACYNWKCEKAFFGDIEAFLPEPGTTFDDDEDISDGNVVSSVKDQEVDENLNKEDSSKKVDKEVVENLKKEDSSKEVDNRLKIKEAYDPLQSKSHRKTDSDKNLSCGVPIRDFSDPLHSTMSVDDEVFLPKEEAKLIADTQSERWSLDDAVVWVSPSAVVAAPFLESEAGRRCALRKHFPRPLLPPARPAPRPAPRPATPPPADTPIERHPFIKYAMAAPADDPAVKAALANFRATGGIYPDQHKHECPLYNPSVLKETQKKPESDDKPLENEPLDPYAPENHQRLSVLLYSYSNKSANVPDFCVNPWIVTMEMYGQHDISLAAFLEKYCYNGAYKCPSNNCSVPMNQHVRKFVHNDVCITITCNTVAHSNVDKFKEEQNKQVTFWTRCEECGECGRLSRLSRAALALSLCAYLRWRAAPARALRHAARPRCAHPLHAHTHTFGQRHTTASFRYSKITTYDIQLPPNVITTYYDSKKMREALIQQLNDVMLRGHETFSILTESEAEKDHQTFKQHTDQILVSLTSANLQENTSFAGVVRSLWSVSDRIIFAEKMLRDAQEKWSGQRHVKQHTDAAIEEKSDIEDSTGESGNNDSSDNVSKDYAGTEEDEEKGDKKTVRQILAQLLTNNQPANQGGIIISSGVIPVVVHAADIGSVIAATLASVTYNRTLRNQKHSTQTEPEESENMSSGRDKTDGDKSKAVKSNDHIEVLLKDGLLCRVYYAWQFQRLRHALLSAATDTGDTAPDTDSDTHKCYCDDKERPDSKSLCEIEEGFLRSLAQCVPWAARGGKSGSTFCKTKDDRYVLKEMTKPEWQQFLEFAPHYFNYINNAHQNNLPTLLARIVGVYSVGGAGTGILVSENVWYRRPGHTRYDLKGSARHRLAPPEDMAVLMDENLLQLRWDSPLYIASHAARVLWRAADLDTAFLAAHLVMDYSLLLALGTRTLGLGLVDYIRTFTWDKKLEHLVKKNLGSGQPTVLSPHEYRRRFLEALRKYFLPCPEPWDHLYDLLDRPT